MWRAYPLAVSNRATNRCSMARALRFVVEFIRLFSTA
jgi:hypothetical protein